MEMKFKEKLGKANTRVNNISRYLGLYSVHNGVKEFFDIDCIGVSGIISFELEPDIMNYGLDGISLKVTSLTATITWSIGEDELTVGEIKEVVAAGGTHLRSGYIEGDVEVSIGLDDPNWAVDLEYISFTKKGAIFLSKIEIYFEEKGKGSLLLSS